jgi:hypothetical protein
MKWLASRHAFFKSLEPSRIILKTGAEAFTVARDAKMLQAHAQILTVTERLPSIEAHPEYHAVLADDIASDPRVRPVHERVYDAHEAGCARTALHERVELSPGPRAHDTTRHRQ